VFLNGERDERVYRRDWTEKTIRLSRLGRLGGECPEGVWKNVVLALSVAGFDVSVSKLPDLEKERVQLAANRKGLIQLSWAGEE